LSEVLSDSFDHTSAFAICMIFSTEEVSITSTGWGIITGLVATSGVLF
jgi:hypothetical protein